MAETHWHVILITDSDLSFTGKEGTIEFGKESIYLLIEFPIKSVPDMLFLYTSIIYSVITLGIALVIFFKSGKTYQSKFYVLCVAFLTLYAIVGVLSGQPKYVEYKAVIQPVSVFLFSMVPFFFLHFILIYTGYSKLFWEKFLIISIYFTGLFGYTMILLGYIPAPLKGNGLLTGSGYIFYLTWVSVFFTIGVSDLYHLYKGISETRLKSQILFTSLAFLILILPGPFCEVILKVVFGESKAWYFVFSAAALIGAIYTIFRHKLIMTFYDALRMSIEVMHDIIIKTDKFMVIESVQGALTANLGFEERELIGKSLDSLFNQDGALNSVQTLLRENNGEVKLFDADAYHKNGSAVPMNFSFTPLTNNEVFFGYVGIGRNICERKRYETELLNAKENLDKLVQSKTAELEKANAQLQLDILEKKQIEEKLIKLNAELQQVNTSKDKFFTVFAHDLKAPFQGLLGYSEALVEDYNTISKDELKEFAESINEISAGVFGMIENLLTWARVRIGRTDTLPVQIVLSELVHSVCNTLSHNALRKNIELCSKVAEDVVVTADKNMLSSILHNLIANAIKFTQPDGQIIISAEPSETFYKISVKDSGMGIPAEALDQIFILGNPYRRKGTAKEDGTGLGLVLCKEMVERQGGTIHVESEQGKGSTFIFTIPAAVE